METEICSKSVKVIIKSKLPNICPLQYHTCSPVSLISFWPSWVQTLWSHQTGCTSVPQTSQALFHPKAVLCGSSLPGLPLFPTFPSSADSHISVLSFNTLDWLPPWPSQLLPFHSLRTHLMTTCTWVFICWFTYLFSDSSTRLQALQEQGFACFIHQCISRV